MGNILVKDIFLEMGGCCCSSRKARLQGTPVYYYCPPALEERRTFGSCNSSAPGFPAGLLVGLNLDTSSPDTYRPPPAPIPFSVLFGRPHSPLVTLGSQGGRFDVAGQSVRSKPVSEAVGADGFETSTSQDDVNKSDCKTLADILLASPTKSETENLKTNQQNELASEEEDGCPICLEVYDAENPKLVTNCEHEFHLSCILEWAERSDSCPVCDKEMMLDHNNE